MFSEFDPILMAEATIVAFLILMQLVVFVRNNRTIATLKKIYPSGSLLETKDEELIPGSGPHGQRVALLGDNRGFSAIFKEISRTINAYLKRNRGEADGEVLEDIAQVVETCVILHNNKLQ